MTRDDEDPSRTACALGERSDSNRELVPAERARIEHAALLAREVLRATDVAGLDATMRAQIAARAARHRPPRSRPVLLASALGGALMIALTLFLAVVRPAQERAELAERARVERVRVERVRVEREAEARRAELERAQAMRAAEQAERLSAAEAARAKAERIDDTVRAAPAARVRPAAKPASRAASASAGACESSDPLCGL